MSHDHTVLFSADQIAEAVRRIADEVDANSTGDSLIVVAVLKGAVMFTADLTRAMSTPTELAFITASSYTEDFTPGDDLELHEVSTLDVEGRQVLIADDIVDTGRTLRALAEMIRSKGAARVTTAALISKTSRRSTEGDPDHHGFEIDDEFIYGYGMDWNERYRDLSYIALAD